MELTTADQINASPTSTEGDLRRVLHEIRPDALWSSPAHQQWAISVNALASTRLAAMRPDLACPSCGALCEESPDGRLPCRNLVDVDGQPQACAS